jgi:hypothetical protein
MYTDGSPPLLQAFLDSHARKHNGFFENAAVENDFSLAVMAAFGVEVLEGWGARDTPIAEGDEGVRKTAGCGNLIDRVQKAYSCK